MCLYGVRRLVALWKTSRLQHYHNKQNMYHCAIPLRDVLLCLCENVSCCTMQGRDWAEQVGTFSHNFGACVGENTKIDAWITTLRYWGEGAEARLLRHMVRSSAQVLKMPMAQVKCGSAGS